MNIAMWSGPRNLSTAMMRSFASRADCSVMDEPFYASYLARTGLDHPMSKAIIDSGETDPHKVAASCCKASCQGLIYQKHMTHHMIDGFPRNWLKDVVNVFLIRDPARVVASYHAKRELPELADLGFQQQAELFDMVADHLGRVPAVIDANDIRQAPKKSLSKLCDVIGIPFDKAMLSWPRGRQPEDGIWGEHWYPAVWQSTGFAPPETNEPAKLPYALASVVDAARPLYKRLSRYKMNVKGD